MNGMDEKHYDLIVIGGGSGLNVASACANNENWRVAVIEKGPLGGTCLNRGCIPSKMLIHVADIVETIQTAKDFGVNAKLGKVDFKAIMAHTNALIEKDAQNIETGIDHHKNIDHYNGLGTFVAPKKVHVGGETLTADRILIAAGARPFVPPIPGLDTVTYWTSTEALDQARLPKNMIIIGGGYIGAELGHFYGTLGTDITVIEMMDTLLFREDRDIAETFTEEFGKKHTLILESKVASVEKVQSGARVNYTNKAGAEQYVEAEVILLATGTKPNSDGLNLDVTSIKTTDRGYIAVNQFLETTEPGVWALGDIIGKAPFKHGANYEAQHVYWNITGEDRVPVSYDIMPHAVFSSPQIAGVGMTEQQAEEQGLDVVIKKYPFTKTGMGTALHAEYAFIKYILSSNGETILGCHILGPQASTLIHEVVLTMSANAGKVDTIADTIYIHPALSEVVQRGLR